MNDSVKYIVIGGIVIIGIIVIMQLMKNQQPSNSNTTITNDSHNVQKNTSVNFDMFHDISAALDNLGKNENE